MVTFCPKFWLKSLLCLLTPGGYGYYRKLHEQQDPVYVHERDMHPLRKKHHSASGWQREDDQVVYRDCESYDEYVTHQQLKCTEMLKSVGGLSNRSVFAYRLKLYRRFRHLPRYLPKSVRILCLGARQGTEVEVLRDLGFRAAYGIDLNPGPGNPFVRSGDFMHLAEIDASLDLVYSNCIDHALELPSFFAEHARVPKPAGYALYDLPLGHTLPAPLRRSTGIQRPVSGK